MDRDLSAYIEENYQRALEHHHIQAYYQPVIRTLSRHLCSFEALARWIDPDIGMIYPNEFIPVMEKIQAIHLLDACIIRQVCARLRQSMDQGEIPIPVSVNLSRLDFVLCDIFTVVDDIVMEYRIPHEFIYVEITESLMAEQKEMMLEIVDRFTSAGYQVWMDDFGSAYSSLNVLKEFTFAELKLDMMFLQPWTQKSRLIAASVIQMAKRIDLHTLAEGVETEEQFRFFRNVGCEKVQGYYFGKPMPYEEALANLSSKKIQIELPQHHIYYDEIGKTDLLSAAPFMSRETRDSLTEASQLNSIPLAIFEFRRDVFRILFYNQAFENVAAETSLFSVRFRQEILRYDLPYNMLSDRVLNLMDSTRSGEIGRMHFTSKRDYFEIIAKCIAITPGRYTVLVQMTNLTREKKASRTSQLDEYLKQIYSVYERITLINLKEDTITPLYITTREHLVSSTSGIREMAEEYAGKFVFPDDRHDFIQFMDPELTLKRFNETGRTFMSRFLRTSVRHGSYAWKEYTLLRVDEHRFLLLLSNVQIAMKFLEAGNRADDTADPSVMTPEKLWHNLIGANILPLFWKDKDRRFLGATRAFMEYYGFRSDSDFVGMTDEDLGWHIHPDAYMNDELQVLKEGITFRNVPGRCMNEGENREIFASKAPLYDDNGEIAGLLGYFIDLKVLTENDRRGNEASRRDLLTGLLNSRGIAEEAAAFRDEYYLRGLDFVRVHIAIDDFNALNETYGFDFGDRVMASLGRTLKQNFGHTCAIGRFTGQRFVVLHQLQKGEELHHIRKKIKHVASSIKEVDGIPITLYLSVGYVMFSEYPDLDEQASNAEIRLLADTKRGEPTESTMAKSSEIFHLFDDLPMIYGVYHISGKDETGKDAVLFYVNHRFESEFDVSAADLVGRSAREFYPSVSDVWFLHLQKAAWQNSVETGVLYHEPNGKTYRYTASQIIYPGYCAVIYRELSATEQKPE